MYVDPMPSVKSRTSVPHATALLISKLYRPQNKAAFVCQPPVYPKMTVALTWCVKWESATLSVNKTTSVLKVNTVEEFAKEFVSVIVTVCKERFALKAHAYQDAAAILTVAFMKSAFQKNACVTKDSCQARMAVLTSMNVKRTHVIQLLLASIYLAHTSAHVLLSLWVTRIQPQAVSSQTPVLMIVHARVTKHVKKLKMEYWNALTHVLLLCVEIMQDARWWIASLCVSVFLATMGILMILLLDVLKDNVLKTRTAPATSFVTPSTINVLVSILPYFKFFLCNKCFRKLFFYPYCADLASAKFFC